VRRLVGARWAPDHVDAVEDPARSDVSMLEACTLAAKPGAATMIR
jgi:hypothetical protein